MGLPENFLPAENNYITLDVQLRGADDKTLGGGGKLYENPKTTKTHLSLQKFTGLPL